MSRKQNFAAFTIGGGKHKGSAFLERVIVTVEIAVCEDDSKDLARLRAIMNEINVPYSFTVSEYQSAEELLSDIESGRRHFDILFIDIFLKGISGIEAAVRIRKKNENVLLIFVSTSEEFYREAFDVYAFHYLIKPVNAAEFAAVFEKALRTADKVRDDILNITYCGKSRMLKYSDIVYISSSNHKLCIYLTDGSEAYCYSKLDELASQIKSDLFVRCHKSFMVNLSHIREMTSDGFLTDSGALIPISRTCFASAKESYHRRLFGIFQNN